MNLTTEQQSVIDDVKAGNHVSVTALPGSGKSRVAYELIRQCTEDTSVVLIMYNRSLCESTTEHIKRLDIDPSRKVKAFTFHGLASSLTGSVCHNDRQIQEVLKTKNESKWHMEDFTLLIIDEGQDMRPGFMQLIHYLIQSACIHGSRLRIVLLGDPRQLLYGFYAHNRADARFLSLGHVLLRPVNKRTWKQRNLTRSFRSTNSVTNFLNVLIPGHNMVSNGQEGVPVTLDLCNLRSFEPATKIINAVSNFRPEDFMVLCSSLSATSPARKLVRMLVRHGIPVHVQRSGNLRDNGPVATASRHGRIQFKTFCASKGLEAKLVIVLNDRSLFKGMENSLYVALSRSMEQLIIFQNTGPVSMEEIDALRNRLMPADLSVVTNRYSKCRPLCRPLSAAIGTNIQQTKYFVETLFQYVDPELLTPIEKMVQRTSLDSTTFDDEEIYAQLFDIKTETDQCINVRSIVTTAIRLAVEYFRTKQIPKVILDLHRSRDPYVARLFARGMLVLRMNLPHVSDPWNIQQTFMKLQAFAMFSTAIDAFSSFDEKIADLSDFGFIMHPLIIKRVSMLLHHMKKYIPETQTSFSRRETLRTGTATIYSTPTLKSTACVYSMLHKPDTDIDDVLCMAVHVAVHGLEYGYLTNVYTGSLTQVHIPSSDHTTFLCKVIQARESCEDDLDDTGFIRRHRLRISHVLS